MTGRTPEGCLYERIARGRIAKAARFQPNTVLQSQLRERAKDVAEAEGDARLRAARIATAERAREARGTARRQLAQ